MGVESSCSSAIAAAPAGALARPFCQILLEFFDSRRKLIFVLIAITYLLGFNGQWRMGPDSGLYLNLARSLETGQGYVLQGVHHQTVYPGLPLALAGLLRISHGHVIFAADLLILACALASLALVYRLVLLAYDRPTAVIIVSSVAFNHEFFRYSFEILTDMPFLTGVMALLAGHEAIFGPRAASTGLGRAGGRARWWDWALLIAGLAIAVSTRPTMIGLLMAWIVALFFCAITGRNRRAAAVSVVLCLVAVAVFLVLDPRRIPGHGPAGLYEQYAFHQLTDRLPHVLRVNAVNNLYDLLVITAPRAVFGMDLLLDPANVVFACIVLAAGVALIRKRLFWGLWIIITLLTLILLLSVYRYMLQILPLLILGWWNLLRSINLRFPRRLGNVVFALLLSLGAALNGGQVIAFIVHQRARPFLADYQKGIYPPYVQMAHEIPNYTTDRDLILCPLKLARIMEFLADRNFAEPNASIRAEPIRAEPGHLLAILDPKDVEYSRWLGDQHVKPEGDFLVSVPRAGGRPAVRLVRARIAPEPK
jgi:hypothetical protein